jgi:hypothetical protein
MSLNVPPRVQIAFLTGRSNPDSCALSPIQRAFLARLAGPGRLLVPYNFPYQPEPAERPHRPTGLLAASLNNYREYRNSRRPDYRQRYGPGVKALLDRAPRTVFLVGSCGLELLHNLGLEVEDLARTVVFAFGPVARAFPDCSHVVVQGRRDWISRWFVASPNYELDCGHLAYLRHEQVHRICDALVCRVAAESGAPE